MEINVINEYRFEMELREDELSDFDITYESLDYGDINTRRFLQELADSARKYGVYADMSGKVLIEAFRTKDGCRVCFTFLPSKNGGTSTKQLVKKDATYCTVSGENINAVTEFAALLPQKTESSLFYSGGKYMLFIVCTPSKINFYRDIADEYGIKFFADTFLSMLSCREHAVCVFEKNAVKNLSFV